MDAKIWIVIWSVVLIGMIPGAMVYTHYLAYSNENNIQTLADKLLANSSLDRQTIYVIVNESPTPQLSKAVLEVEGNLSQYGSVSSPYSQYLSFLTQVTGNSTLARNYVLSHGLQGSPPFVRELVSSDNSSFLITLTLNYSNNFVYKNGSTPSEILTPIVQSEIRPLGPEAYVTGTGAIAYETQELTQKYAFVFPSLFLVLAIAIGVALRSIKAGLLGFVFVGLTLYMSYFSVYLTGLILGGVDYVVNYTLTAVILGITTDYFIFLIYRYKRDKKSINGSRKAILISGLTVGFSLATFSLVKGFLSWGIVLLLSVILSALLMITLLPAVISIFGGKLVKTSEYGTKESIFSKASRVSLVYLVLILLVAVPAIYFFFHVPTTYNFNTGLPSSLNSVKGLTILERDYGFPIIVLVNKTQASASLASFLQKYGNVVGPYVSTSNVSQFTVNNGYVYYLIYVKGSPYSTETLNVVKTLENHHLIVGGLTSDILALQRENVTVYSLLELLVVSAVGLVLGLSFRTWKYPLISLSGVLISVTEATAILYLIARFLLHIELIYLVPVIIFVILTSLGSDYSVFIISSVEEEREKGGDYVSRGMGRTGSIVTTLGIILAISLGTLAFIPIAFLQELGISFVVSIVIDTFVIRTFYYPLMIRILYNVRNKT
ncbi:MAG: MMPL family transporter [Metallosphaera sp.]|uniref:MMPL family transporter n=1 Tax=Metallosphaera sp. TaxID=2020860 RepID=UPI00317EAEF7